LISDEYAEKVKRDIHEASEIGVQGVPFFVFDRKYAVSGAQPPEYFLQTLKKSFGEWKKANPDTELAPAEGAVCNPDGDCT
jgi:predicted DsbA family dithiol-disulfide isomerase